jgi:regulatory protein
MRISRLSRQKRHSDRYNLFVDGEYRYALPEELVLRHRLTVGQEVDEAFLADLEAATASWRVRDTALRLLAHRPRSEWELKHRLLRRSFPAPAVERCIEQLRATGLLDDRAFAEELARHRIRNRPLGRRRLLLELRAKGIAPEVAAAAVAAAFGEERASELDLAHRAAAKFRRRSGEDRARARRRLAALLSRRGFPGEVVREVMQEFLP